MSKNFVPRTTVDRNSSVETSAGAELLGTQRVMPIPERPSEEGSMDSDACPSLTASENELVIDRAFEITQAPPPNRSNTFTPRRPVADNSLNAVTVNGMAHNPLARSQNISMLPNDSIRNLYRVIPNGGNDSMLPIANHYTSIHGFCPSATDPNSKQCEPQTAFLTYVKDEASLVETQNLADVLITSGINIKIDFYDKKLMGMGINQWINDNIQESDHIIVCINKSYKSAVSETYGGSSENVKHAITVYNQLQTILMNANSMNYRILPVIVGNATRDDVPLVFQNTFVYRWPQHYEEILRRVFKIPERKPPALGRPPKMVLEKY